MNERPTRRKIVLSVTSDLVSDYRVHRTALTLQQKCGMEVVVVGRKLRTSPPLSPRPYAVCRLSLPAEKGFLFYAGYNIVLFLYLMFNRFDLLWANDLDTLPANYLAAKLKRKKLIVDYHELFTGVPELTGRDKVRWIWQWFERSMLPAADVFFTVNQSIAAYYQKLYGLKAEVLRNVPYRPGEVPEVVLPWLGGDKKVIIYQGVVNVGRGLEKVIRAMSYLENAVFVIVGDGDVMDSVVALVKELKVEERVFFTGRVPFETLPSYLKKAHLGISLEEKMGESYFYALPNKLFAYIQAELPVLVSDFPEMKAIVEGYDIGRTTLENDPQRLAGLLDGMLRDVNEYERWKRNLKKAARELCWENEEQKLIDRMQGLVAKDWP